MGGTKTLNQETIPVKWWNKKEEFGISFLSLLFVFYVNIYYFAGLFSFLKNLVDDIFLLRILMIHFYFGYIIPFRQFTHYSYDYFIIMICSLFWPVFIPENYFHVLILHLLLLNISSSETLL